MTQHKTKRCPLCKKEHVRVKMRGRPGKHQFPAFVWHKNPETNLECPKSGDPVQKERFSPDNPGQH